MLIQEQTKELMMHLEQLKERFEQSDPPESVSDQAFFAQMKLETERVFTVLEEWETDALALVKQRLLPIHPHQVASARENMELLIMHSYYIDCRRRIYMDMYKSIKYAFQLIVDHEPSEMEEGH